VGSLSVVVGGVLPANVDSAQQKIMGFCSSFLSERYTRLDGAGLVPAPPLGNLNSSQATICHDHTAAMLEMRKIVWANENQRGSRTLRVG
jgi:hypothetical protein